MRGLEDQRSISLTPEDIMDVMTEAEFERNSSSLWGQIEDALAIHYSFEQINDLALGDEQALNALQRDALFWNVQKHALQTALIIILGRIFDLDTKAYSIHRLIRDTEANFELFSHAALKSRKERLNLPLDVLEDYFVGLWRPEPACLMPLRQLLASHIKQYKKVYRPLRNAVYAHSLTTDAVEIRGVFANTNRAELEQMLLAAREVVGVIQEMYQNGSEPVLGRMVHDGYERECRQAVATVVSKIKLCHPDEMRA